jgi:hypothetical protein
MGIVDLTGWPATGGRSRRRRSAVPGPAGSPARAARSAGRDRAGCRLELHPQAAVAVLDAGHAAHRRHRHQLRRLRVEHGEVAGRRNAGARAQVAQQLTRLLQRIDNRIGLRERTAERGLHAAAQGARFGIELEPVQVHADHVGGGGHAAPDQQRLQAAHAQAIQREGTDRTALGKGRLQQVDRAFGRRRVDLALGELDRHPERAGQLEDPFGIAPVGGNALDAELPGGDHEGGGRFCLAARLAQVEGKAIVLAAAGDAAAAVGAHRQHAGGGRRHRVDLAVGGAGAVAGLADHVQRTGEQPAVDDADRQLGRGGDRGGARRARQVERELAVGRIGQQAVLEQVGQRLAQLGLRQLGRIDRRDEHVAGVEHEVGIGRLRQQGDRRLAGAGAFVGRTQGDVAHHGGRTERLLAAEAAMRRHEHQQTLG